MNFFSQLPPNYNVTKVPDVGVLTPVAEIFRVCEAVSHNLGYIKHCYTTCHEALNREYRVMFVGHGRSGKDTAAGILGELLGYRGVGSTSYGVIPLVTFALTGRTDIATQNACYADRHNNRPYWFDFCNLLRRIDPLMLLKLTLATTDFVIGTRSKAEFDHAIEFYKPTNVFWMERRGIPHDPTLEFDRSYVAERCNAHGIRHTTLGNNDDLDCLETYLKWCLDTGLLKSSKTV